MQRILDIPKPEFKSFFSNIEAKVKILLDNIAGKSKIEQVAVDSKVLAKAINQAQIAGNYQPEINTVKEVSNAILNREKVSTEQNASIETKYEKFQQTLTNLDSFFSNIEAKVKILLDNIAGKSKIEQEHRQLEQVAVDSKVLAKAINQTPIANNYQSEINTVKEVSNAILNREKVSTEQVEQFKESLDKLLQAIDELPEEITTSLTPVIQNLKDLLQSNASIETKYEKFQKTLINLDSLKVLPEELRRYQNITKEEFVKSQKEIITTLNQQNVLDRFQQEQSIKDLVKDLKPNIESFDVAKEGEEKSLFDKFREMPELLSKGRGAVSSLLEMGFSALGMPAVGNMLATFVDSGMFDLLGKLNPKKLTGLLSVVPALANKLPVVGNLLAKLPALSSLGKVGSGGLLKGGLGLLGKVALPLTAITAGYGAFKGWNKAEEIFGKNANLGQKLSSALGGALSTLSFGIIPTDVSAKFFYKIGETGVNFFKKAFEFSPVGIGLKVGKFLFAKGKSLAESIGISFDNVGSFVSSSIDVIGKGFSFVKEKVESVINGLLNFFNIDFSKLPSIPDLIKKLITKLIPGGDIIASGIEKGAEVTKSVFSSVKSFFFDKEDKANQTTKQIISNTETVKQPQQSTTSTTIIQSTNSTQPATPSPATTQKEIDSYGIAFTNAMLFD